MTLHNINMDQLERRCGVNVGMTENDFGLGYKQIDSFIIYPDTHDQKSYEQMTNSGVYQKPETVWICGFLKPEMVLLDTLADVGYYTFLGAQLIGTTGWVISIEHRNVKSGLFHRAKSQNRSWNIAEINRNVIMDPMDDLLERIGRRPHVDLHRISADGEEFLLWKTSTKFRKRDKPIVMLEITEKTRNLKGLAKGLFEYGTVHRIASNGAEIQLYDREAVLERERQTLIIKP